MCLGRGIPECYTAPKYIPKVGEICDYRFNMWGDESLWHKVKVTAVTDISVIVVNGHGEHLLDKERFSFRKIQSEEEKFITAFVSKRSKESHLHRFARYEEDAKDLYSAGFRYVGEDK